MRHNTTQIRIGLGSEDKTYGCPVLLTPLPGAQPPRGAGGSRRAQGNALSPERLMAHQPGRNGPRQGREAGILGSSSPEQRVRELADPKPSLNNMQARALLGTGKAQSSRFGNHSCAQSTGSIGRALSTGTRRGATPRIGADWPNQDQEEEEDYPDDEEAQVEVEFAEEDVGWMDHDIVYL